MPEMGVAGVADGFDSLQKRRSVKAVGDYVRSDRLSEGRPTGARLELFRGVEENRLAAEARIDTRLKQSAHLRAERALGAGLAGHVIFFRAELQAPLSIRFC